MQSIIRSVDWFFLGEQRARNIIAPTVVCALLVAGCPWSASAEEVGRAADTLAARGQDATSHIRPPQQGSLRSPYVVRLSADDQLELPRPGIDPLIGFDKGGWTEHYFPFDLDVTIVMPRDRMIVAAEPLLVHGGRRVRVIGGHIRAANAKTSAWLIADTIGESIFFEGLHVDVAGYHADAIVAREDPAVRRRLAPGTGPYDLYVQNTLIEGVAGTFDTRHGDVLQYQTRIGRLYVENLTAATQYQGLFIPSSTTGPGAAEAFLRRVNLKTDRNIPGADRPGLLWIRLERDRAPRPDTPWYPVHFDEVYVEESPLPGFRPWHVFSITPGTNQPWAAVASPDQSNVTYPPDSGVTGEIRRGPPLGGDFVRPEQVGVNYVSPWGEPPP
jgi:hypothetical protein